LNLSTSVLKDVPPSPSSAINGHPELPPVKLVFVGADYTLRNPAVKVAETVTHTISANLYVRETAPLASPLG
jgi:hypothetical protein